jgi:L-malate glycosyltransferase
MRVCIFVDSYHKGGVDTFILNLLQSWPNKNDNFILLHNESYPSIDKIHNSIIDNVKFKSYNFLISNDFFMGKSLKNVESKILVIAKKILLRILRYCLLPFYLIKTAFLLNEFKHDKIIVVNGGYPGSLIARLATLIPVYVWKKKIIFNIHSHAIFPAGTFNFLDKFLDRLFRNRLITFVSVSNSCTNSIKRRLNFDNERFITIYNGIRDPSKGGEIDTIKHKNKSKYILFLATFHEYKGHEFLLESFLLLRKLLPEVQLKIFGDGELHDKVRIQSIIERLKLTEYVEFGCYIDDVDSLIRGAEIVVLPSQAYESFGYVIIEAFARRVPVVATNIGGIPEVLEHGRQGFLSDPRDSILFSQYLLKILCDESLSNSLAESGRKRYLDHFTSGKMAKAYFDILEQID